MGRLRKPRKPDEEDKRREKAAERGKWKGIKPGALQQFRTDLTLV